MLFFYKIYNLTNQVCIQLGSNIGKRAEHLKSAQKLLSENMTLENSSSIYETEAWGMKNQMPFYNQILIFRTNQSPYFLLKMCQKIEDIMGRSRDLHWGPRIIDLDIIFYSNKIIFSPELKIPHPWMQDRRFVLKPLVDIAKTWIHPIFGISAEQLLADCKDNSEVKLIPVNGVRDTI